jgi:translocation and assembly module TamA
MPILSRSDAAVFLTAICLRARFALGLALPLAIPLAILLGLIGCAGLSNKATTASPQSSSKTTGATGSGVALASSTVVKAASKVAIKLNGIEDKPTRLEVLKAIELRSIRKKNGATEAQVRRLFKRADKQILRALEPFGFYNASLTSDLRLDGEKWRATFNVAPGVRTSITDVDFQIDGPAALDERITKAWNKIALKPGEPLDHTRYELVKAELQRALIERGYLAAEPSAHKVQVTRKSNTAKVQLHWASGVRYAYGQPRFTGAQFPNEFMQRYLNFEPGDLYTQKRLLDLQNRLLASDYFSGVEIVPETDELAEGAVPISITLTPAKRSVYSYGVNYGTDSGFGVRSGLERRWLNSRGHKFRTGAEVSQRLKTATLNYDIPLPGKARTTYGINLGYRDETTDDIRAKVRKLGLSRTWESKGWQQTLAAQWLGGDFIVGGVPGRSTLFYPEWIAYKRSADELLYPREGYSVTLNARAGIKALLSDASFANVSTDLRYIRPLGENSRLLLRGSAGALWTDNFDLLPPELRFFAGGDRSVRGYRYQALGPRNGAGRVRGGKYLAVLSGEYEYALNERYAIASFVDLGNAFDPRVSNLGSTKIGAGVGLRWHSPVGAVRLDVAYALDEPGTPARLHLIIGPDL